ncbi:hypothetical protein G7Y89_g10627 [Cudoniella acicularis]|uniref:Uncharacterized protein n=1 Tax=Cudoniella acicularis TaxID=354080 RepID=A0A8H4RCE4_9HELO|nr:hypothetical protein G7Y89_g10627 [Cudoniella acicularis]
MARTLFPVLLFAGLLTTPTLAQQFNTQVVLGNEGSWTEPILWWVYNGSVSTDRSQAAVCVPTPTQLLAADSRYHASRDLTSGAISTRDIGAVGIPSGVTAGLLEICAGSCNYGPFTLTNDGSPGASGFENLTFPDGSFWYDTVASELWLSLVDSPPTTSSVKARIQAAYNG